jgi:hypothetical protein
MAQPGLRRVEIDWTAAGPLVASDLEVLKTTGGGPQAGDQLPSGRLARKMGVLIATYAPDRPSPRPRYFVIAATDPSHNRDIDVEQGRARIVVGIEKMIGGQAVWFAGVAAQGEALGHIEYQGVQLTALAVSTEQGAVKRAFLGVLTEDGRYTRLSTVGVALLGQPGPVPQPPASEPEIADMHGDIPILEPPLYVS